MNQKDKLTLSQEEPLDWFNFLIEYVEQEENWSKMDKQAIEQIRKLLLRKVSEEFVEKWAKEAFYLPLSANEHWKKSIPKQIIRMLKELGYVVAK